MKTRSLGFSTAVAVLGTLSLNEQLLAQDTSPRRALETVVVTAQRTEESLQRTPVSVSALDAYAIERFQIDNVKDVGQVVPNVTIRPVTGGTGGITPFIRGGSVTDGANITSEPEVGIYIDDVFQPRAAASFIEALDIERIEILRGPQGTLYGRNSSAGALKVITRAPGEELRIKAEAGVGIWNERYGKFNVSGPLSEDGKLRGGFSGIIRDRDGGRQNNPTLGRDVGEEEYLGFQGDLYYEAEDWDVRLTAFMSDYESDGLYASSVNPFSLDQPYRQLPFNSGAIDRVVSPYPSYTDSQQAGLSLHASWDLGNTGTLSSITSWSTLEDDFAVGFSGGVPAAFLGIPSGGFVELFERESMSDQDSFSQELRLDGQINDTFIDYLVGLYYFRESGDLNATQVVFFSPTFPQFSISTDSYAAFGQLSFNLSEKLSLTIGGRYTEDKKKLDAEIGGVPVNRSDTFSEFTPKASVEYQWTDDLFVYGSYTEGFKSGGYNGLAGTAEALNSPFDTQNVSAWELGFKSEFLDQRLRLNVAAFFNDYEGLQQQSVTNEGVFITENYDTEHWGIEAELSAQLSPSIYLWANAVRQDSEYTDVSASGGAASGALIGNNMVNVFESQFAIGLDYTRDIGPGTFAFGVNANRKDDFFSTPDNAPMGHVPPVTLVDAYASYAVDKWTVRLAGKNLTDEEYWFTGFGFSLVQARFMADPMTWRLSATYEF
ncbi:MAG: TonB-dependent receptor [Congregibacter sp.]